MARALSFFRDILQKAVVDCEGKRVGFVRDLAAGLDEKAPPIRYLVVGARATTRFGRERPDLIIPWIAVEKLAARAIRLKGSLQGLAKLKLDRGQILLKQHLMDRQIVDQEGYKLFRVDDVKLLATDGGLKVAGLHAGLSGLFLRLGSRRRLPTLLRRLGIQLRDNVIPWELVERIDAKPRQIRLKVTKRMLKDGGVTETPRKPSRPSS